MPPLTRSGKQHLDVKVSGPVETLVARFLQHAAPWIVWLLGLPLGALTFWLLGHFTGRHAVVVLALAGATVITSWVVWRFTHSRGGGRLHHAINTAACLGWVTLVTWQGLTSLLLIAYLVGGLVLVLTWNVRYTPHGDAAEDAIARKDRAKRVEVAYVVRAATNRTPAVRAAAERVGRVVPAVAAPWRPEVTAADAPAALPAAPPDATASDTWARISRNFRRLAAQQPDLSGARLRLLGLSPHRIRSEIILVRGYQVPKQVVAFRDHFAGMNALPLSSVVIKENRKNHARVFVDWVIRDTLTESFGWPGASAPGKSIASAPLRFGMYEDGRYQERFGPAITEDMTGVVGRPEKNLSHLITEGMNGSGKSTMQRALITDAASRLDIVEWLIDTVKKFQTFGQLGEAFDWFATTTPEAKSMIRFLAQWVIPGRAEYLGVRGLDNWVPGCGIPYLRVTVEEGGIVSNELDHLDDVLNSARSTGTEVNLSAQRAHHALVDTNVRAALGDSASFGCKEGDDSFVMPPELAEAGADPSVWANKQPGMNYYAAADLDLDAQLIPGRGFKMKARECREEIARWAPQRAAYLAAECPDWPRLLESWDGHGVYSGRTRGADVLAQIGAAQATPPAPSTAVAARPSVTLSDPPPVDADDDIEEAEVVPTYAEEDPIVLDELADELGDETAAAVAEDLRDGIDPRVPIPDEDPDMALVFTPADGTPAKPDMTREDALDVVRSRLAARGPGFRFAPRDVYDELCAATGKSASWVRTELSTTLLLEGLLSRDRLEGKYEVCEQRQQRQAS